MAYNDLINVTFEDAASYITTQGADVLGVIMPYHWGPSGKVNVYNKAEFFTAYPEDYNPVSVAVPTAAGYTAFAQVKSYFANGGSYVAIYRPEGTTPVRYGNTTAMAVDTSVNLYAAFKYYGIPSIPNTININVETATGTPQIHTVTLRQSVNPSATTPVWTEIEKFVGQVTDPNGKDEYGASSYLPTIIANNSQYLALVSVVPTAIPTDGSVGPLSAGASETLAAVFGDGDELLANQFLDYDTVLEGFNTATFYKAVTSYTDVLTKGRFNFAIIGKEKINIFKNIVAEIDCNAGVAGADARIAANSHVNQIASGRTYGAYTGTLSSSWTFTQAKENMEKGFITVFNSVTTGPQIFGTRNTFVTPNVSYYSRRNVSRTLAAILRRCIPMCMNVIHTDAADNPVSRSVFEAQLKTIINSFIATQDLKDDSTVICNASNNSEVQTNHGIILNIILALHFIGLVEKVNIRVVATDSGVTIATD